MSELTNIQKAAQTFRNTSSQAGRTLQTDEARLVALKRKFEKAARAMNEDQLIQARGQFEKEKKSLEENINRQKQSAKELLERYRDQLQVFLPELNPQTATGQLNDDTPILLFPLRLEIRFKINGNQHQLWLRVYPDDCNVSHKENLLSESELNNAKQFWIAMAKAGGVETDERGAWAVLVNSHGSGRSAYIVNEYKPAGSIPAKADASQHFLIITSDVSLTNDEKNAAANYWIDYWLANKDQVKIKLAQDNLNALVGSQKAEEINSQYIPANILDPVPEGITKEKVFVHVLNLPDYVPKETSWSQAPVADLLPDKFVVILKKGNTARTEMFPHGIKDKLPVGPDPSLSADQQIKKDANGNIIVNEELQWMVDFEKAVEVGMAIKIDISDAEFAAGFDSLKVVGLRFTSDKSHAKQELENLFTNHFYSKGGFGLLKQGTPTNNTEELPAGFTWIDDPDDSYERVFKNREHFDETDDLEKKSDGNYLADALGIDASVLQLFPNANGTDQLEANAMNKALFTATMGYFMEEMMHPLFSDNDINHTRNFFTSYVSGRGPVPAIHVGKQPYGILPVSVYSRLNFSGRLPDRRAILVQDNFILRLYNLLKKMDIEWKNLISTVPHVTEGGRDPQQVLLDVIGLHAHSVEFHQRYAQTEKQLYNYILLWSLPLLAKDSSEEILNRSKKILSDLGLDPEMNLPILKKFFLGKPNLLKGPFIDDVPESEMSAVRAYSVDNKNYIEWLASSDANTVRMEDFGGNEAPTALLYILLRHSLQQAQSDAASRVLISNKVIENKSVYFDPDFLHIEVNEKGKSKYESLYSAFPAITGNDTMVLAEHIYRPEILSQRTETIHLNETLEALKVLEKVPTARLARLFAEHLDCCSYRLDAWFTGLVNYKLQEQRAISVEGENQSKGIYLGAYGWLLDVKPENKILENVELNDELAAIFKPDDGSTLKTDSTNLGYIHAPSLNQAATAAILRNAFDSNNTGGSENPFAINLSSDRVRVSEVFLEGVRNGQSLAALLGYHFERGLHDKHTLGAGEVDKFIYPLRKVFPLTSNQLDDTKTEDDVSIESIEARNVIDGLKLIQHVQGNTVKTYPFGIPAEKGLPSATSAQANAINQEVNAIIEIHDAIGDVVLSEQIYQTVLGNIDRAAGNADAFSKGNYPPDIAVVDTPRTGTTLTHRMAIQLNASAAVPVDANPRRKAEPALSEWLISSLPAPDKVQCKVIFSSPSTPETTVFVSQQDVGLDAMDLIYLLETDTEQGMTELDDRIASYVRYNIHLHPDTNVFIQYTEEIDAADKSKISFFELSSLVNSIRRIVRGNRYLKPSHLALSQAGETVAAPMNDVLMKQRIVDARDSLQLKLNDLSALKLTFKSIASLSAGLKSNLELSISEPSVVLTITSQMGNDLKDFLIDKSLENKNAKLTAFETSINAIGNAVTIATLKTQYENAMDAYVADFQNIDAQIKQVTTHFQQVSLYQAQPTGTGFMQQGIKNVYKIVFEKCDEVIERWQSKSAEFDTLLAGYDSGGIADEQFNLLKRSEQIISTQITTPLPANFNDYKTNSIDVKKSAYDAQLNKIKSHATNNKPTVIEFITDVENSLVAFAEFDAIKFDQKLQRNDLASEKLLLAGLKEDIVIAIGNVLDIFNKAIADCNTSIAESDAVATNADKIASLAKAGKAIFGDDAIMLPQFTPNDITANEMENAYNAGINESILNFAQTKANQPMPVEDWLTGMARVKTRVHDWEHITFLSHAFKPSVTLDLVPLQFPYQPDDRWLAVTFKDPNDPTDLFSLKGDKLLYTTHFASPFNKLQPQCGIIIDEWTEVIPNQEETTGIAFHYDQPNSEPSQAMLLVVPPQIKGKWEWADLVDALDETLEMAKKRAIEPAKIEEGNYAQFLPTTLMASSRYWINIVANLSMNNQIYKVIK